MVLTGEAAARAGAGENDPVARTQVLEAQLRSQELVAFAAFCHQQTRHFSRLALLITMGTMVVLLPSDLFVFATDPRTMREMVAFRGVLVLLCLCLYAGLGLLPPRSPRVVPACIGTYWLILALSFSFMGLISNPDRPFIFVSFIIPPLSAMFLLPLRSRVVACLGGALVILASYYGPHPDYWANQYTVFVIALLLCSCGGTILASEAHYRLQAEAFRQRAEIARHVQRLEELNKLKDTFVSTVSHELRQPLNLIIGMSTVVLDETLSAPARAHVETIQKSGWALLELIANVLDLARMHAGKLELVLAPVSVPEFVNDSARLFDLECRLKEISLTRHVGPNSPEIRADIARLRQIVINLLSNAIKFTETGAVELRADVDTSLQPAHLVISVADTGPGVPADMHDAVFEEFQQLGDARSRAAGTGLGLPIVRDLCRLMGGTVAIADNVPHGAVFTVRLPVELAAA